ncbi:ABC transporter ATP-binding protein [Fodinicurvata sp. EGI_FJ10296]|uniref:ABC transporter ATP-binding protein n=1 Tax=Fodinicurvata sp. EGI_FJ10296 TaxID=3231908 RepID=UPI0034538716
MGQDGSRCRPETDSSTGTTEPMVRVESVSRKFGTTLAVDAARFEVAKGDFLTILGPSGSGKTTVLRMIAGFLPPTSGEIHINGEAVSDLPPNRRSIGMVFQRLALFPHMTAAQNVAYPLKMRRAPPAEIDDRVERYLDLVQLSGYGARRIHELSGGQQQRVAIARALVFQPDLLLLDEPLAALDKKLREDMQLEFRRIQQELGVTTINVTHDQREALVMSDRVVVMDHGRIQQTAAPETAYRTPSNRFVAGFIGVTNFLPCTVKSAEDGWATVLIGQRTVTGRTSADAVAAGSRADGALRAEQVRLVDEHASLDTVVAATVSEAIFEGDRVVYTVSVDDLDGAAMRVFDHDPLEHRTRKAGEAVHVGWNSRDLMIFPQ